MNYTYFLLPLSILEFSIPGYDSDGNFLDLNGMKIYRLHLVGTIVALELNQESQSGYLLLDDTFSTILVHFGQGAFNYFDSIKRWDMVEVLGSVDINDKSVTLLLNNIKKIKLDRYMYNKLQSIRNFNRLTNGIR